MKNKLLVIIGVAIISFALNSCGNLYYQNVGLAYPITLNEKIGIPKVSTPKNVVNQAEITGNVGASQVSTRTGSGSNQRTETDLTYSRTPDPAFEVCFQKGAEKKKRFANNLKFELDYEVGPGFMSLWINFKADCNEIREGSAK